jgi:hypothetical protein
MPLLADRSSCDVVMAAPGGAAGRRCESRTELASDACSPKPAFYGAVLWSAISDALFRSGRHEGAKISRLQRCDATPIVRFIGNLFGFSPPLILRLCD